MKKSIVRLIVFSVMTGTLVLSCSEAKKEITTSSLLYEMIDRDVVAQFPQSDYRLKQQSSYNRASTSPEDTLGWFINKDYNSNDKDKNFIRIEENKGRKEWVLMEHKGPGAIVRTWMPFLKPNVADADMDICIYLDGAEEPVLEGNMLGLFNGTGLFPFPLAHKSLRSAVSFFPIPYAKSCKITVTGRPFFYQFTYREYKEGTVVKTFNKEDFELARPVVEKVCEALLHPKDDLSQTTKISSSESLAANEEKLIDLPRGEAAIRSLSLKLDNYIDPRLTRFVIIKIKFDGKETIWSPIGDFFGCGIGVHPFNGWYRSVAEDGTLSCRWVMPYQKSASISVLNLSDEALEFELNAHVGDWKWNKQSMYFHAGYRQEYPVSTRPFSDWNYITLKGRGVYVGDALTVMNPVAKWWGEGDEKIWVDGEDFPSMFGTGTEDYYGYSWGGISTDFYEHPFHAQPRAHVYNKLNRKTTKEKNTLGYSTETRTRSLDAMPFSSSLKLDMEVWSWTDCDMGYSVGMYWYGDAETTANVKPILTQVRNFSWW